MKIHWMLVVLVGTLLVAGCRESAKESTQTPPPPEAAPPAVTEPAPAPPPIAAAPEVNKSAPVAEKPAPRPQAKPRPAPGPTTPPVLPSSGATVPARPITPPPAPRQVPIVRDVTVADGTSLRLVLETALSSASAAVETPVRARLQESILVNGMVALPSGTMLTGVVTDTERSGRVKGRAHLAFAFDHAEVRGTVLSLRTHPIRYEAEPSKGDDAAKIGVGAIGGAIIGGIVGGGKGAAKGAAIGGAAGTGAVLVTRGDEVTLTAGTPVVAILAEAMTVPLR